MEAGNDLLAQAIAKTTGAVYTESEIEQAYNTQQTEQQEEPKEPNVAATNEAQTNEQEPKFDEKELNNFYSFFEKKTGKKYEEAESLLKRKSFDEEVSERFGKPLSEVEDVIKTPKQVAKELKTQYAKELEAWVENGGDESIFHEIQRTDWEKMPSDDIIKSELKLKYPKADKSKIDILFKTEYKIPSPLSPDNYSEEEVAERNELIEAAKIKLELQADEIREKRINEKIKALQTPSQRPLTQEQINANKEIQERGERNAKKIFDKLDSYKGLELSIVEKENGKEVVSTLNYIPTQEEQKQVRHVLNNPFKNYFELFIDKDGNVDESRFVESVTLAIAGKNAMEKMAKDLAHEKVEAIIKGLKNPNFKEQPMTSATAQTEQQKRNKELAQNLMGGS